MAETAPTRPKSLPWSREIFRAFDSLVLRDGTKNVEAATGLHRSTIYRIVRGEITPSRRTREDIVAALVRSGLLL